MALAEDLAQLEHQLATLITRYEQYFIGLEKREPLKLLGEVEKIVRRYTNTAITNTMYKHKFNMLTARLNTYREHWNRILRLIEEGKYSRDRFISDLHQRQRATAPPAEDRTRQQGSDNELDRLFAELRDARKNCHLPFETLTRDMVAATIEKSKPALVAKLGTDDISFRIVVENGKPKIKAGPRK
ncbi:MAG: hypothetical protein HXX11_00485 [Desulfuromonadales bacterium]|nr:hypothetical protein [Desulfuromonadales bacterium]